MTAHSVLALGRIAAAALMIDACIVKRTTGSSTDSETGVITPTYTTLYAGKSKVQRRGPRGQSNRPINLGEAFELLSFVEVGVPMSVDPGFVPADIVVITACVNDTDLVDRVFHLRGFEHRSFATARRLQCTESTG